MTYRFMSLVLEKKGAPLVGGSIPPAQPFCLGRGLRLGGLRLGGLRAGGLGVGLDGLGVVLDGLGVVLDGLGVVVLGLDGLGLDGLGLVAIVLGSEDKIKQ
jgi:hypothetical protein